MAFVAVLEISDFGITNRKILKEKTEKQPKGTVVFPLFINEAFS